jgi:hypothetical protein
MDFCSFSFLELHSYALGRPGVLSNHALFRLLIAPCIGLGPWCLLECLSESRQCNSWQSWLTVVNAPTAETRHCNPWQTRANGNHEPVNVTSS